MWFQEDGYDEATDRHHLIPKKKNGDGPSEKGLYARRLNKRDERRSVKRCRKSKDKGRRLNLGLEDQSHDHQGDCIEALKLL